MVGKPIFICGFPKSGTTLVSHLFSHLPKTFIDTELHVATSCLRMATEAFTDGAIKTDAPDKLNTRLADLVEHDFEKYLDHVKELFENLHTGHGFGWRWGNNCKNTIDYIPLLNRMYPEATIIYMLRDPRDVWASVKNSKWSHQNQFADFAFFLKRFRAVYDKAQHPAVTTLLFRDVLCDPQLAFDIIDAKYDPSYLAGTGQVYRYRTLPQRWSEKFEDGLYQREGRYKDELSKDEISAIEAVLPDIMTIFDDTQTENQS